MAKSKYCYVIVNKENGNLLVESTKLPIFWNKTLAKERQLNFGDKFTVCRIELANIEKLILSSKIIK